MSRLVRAAVLAAAAAAFALPSFAADKVRLIVSIKETFELFSAEQAIAEGYFAKEGIEVDVSYGDGGAATMQTIITGSNDVVIGVGSLSVLAAYAKGAPVKVIANGKRGPGPLVWYVPVASPIKSVKDLEGKALAYSRPGSSSHLAGMYVLKDSGVKAKLVSVGGLSASRTQAMSGQVDTGFTVPPVNLDMEAKGQIRIIAAADIDAPGLRNLSIRFTAANADWFAKNRDVARRFVKALWKGVLYNHAGGEAAIRRYAEKWKIDPALARRAPDFLHAESQSPGQLGDLELLEQLALEFKMINAPLTPERRKNLIDIVYDPLKE